MHLHQPSQDCRLIAGEQIPTAKKMISKKELECTQPKKGGWKWWASRWSQIQGHTCCGGGKGRRHGPPRARFVSRILGKQPAALIATGSLTDKTRYIERGIGTTMSKEGYYTAHNTKYVLRTNCTLELQGVAGESAFCKRMPDGQPAVAAPSVRAGLLADRGGGG